MSVRLVLVRHGAAEHTPERRYAGRGTDTDLIPDGQEEARLAAEALKDLRPAAVWSGPLLRQKKTADIIAAAAGAKRTVAGGLNEIDFGVWEGLQKGEIAERWPAAFRAWNEESEWAEGHFGGSEEIIMSGYHDWLNGLFRTSAGTHVAVTSNGLLRLLGRRYLGPQNGPYGVWTGHCCELIAGPKAVDVVSWNVPPRDIS